MVAFANFRRVRPEQGAFFSFHWGARFDDYFFSFPLTILFFYPNLSVSISKKVPFHICIYTGYYFKKNSYKIMAILMLLPFYTRWFSSHWMAKTSVRRFQRRHLRSRNLERKGWSVYLRTTSANATSSSVLENWSTFYMKLFTEMEGEN